MPALVGLLALWLATVCNVALWQQLWALPEVNGWRGLRFMLGMGVWLWGVLAVFISLLAWPKVFKPVAVILLMSAAAATHFMLAFSTLIDPSMLVNVLHTDTKEAADLFSLRLVFTLLVLGVLPAWWLWRQPVRPAKALRHIGTNAATLLVATLVAGLALYVVFQDFASVMRNHKQVRYLINPLNSLYAVLDLAAQPLRMDTRTLAPIGRDAQRGPSYSASASASTAPPLV